MHRKGRDAQPHLHPTGRGTSCRRRNLIRCARTSLAASRLWSWPLQSLLVRCEVSAPPTAMPAAGHGCRCSWPWPQTGGVFRCLTSLTAASAAAPASDAPQLPPLLPAALRRNCCRPQRCISGGADCWWPTAASEYNCAMSGGSATAGCVTAAAGKSASPKAFSRWGQPGAELLS